MIPQHPDHDGSPTGETAIGTAGCLAVVGICAGLGLALFCTVIGAAELCYAIAAWIGVVP